MNTLLESNEMLIERAQSELVIAREKIDLSDLEIFNLLSLAHDLFRCYSELPIKFK